MNAYAWGVRARATAPAVGGCCSSCDEGAPCADPWQGWRPPAPPARVGGWGVERARPFADLEHLNGEIQQFAADVTQAWTAWPGPVTGERLRFTDEWTTLLSRWHPWFAEKADAHAHGGVKDLLTAGAVMGDELARFETFERDFRALVRRFTDELHETTSAKPPPPGSPFDRWLESLGSGAKWAIPVGLGVIALVLLGPALGPAIGAWSAHRAASSAARAAAPKLATAVAA